MKLKGKIKLFGIFIGMIIILSIILSITFKAPLKEIINSEIKASGIIAISLISILLEFLPQPFLSPHAILLQTTLIGFPLLTSLIIILISSSIGSILGFELGRKYKKRLVYQFYSKKEYDKIEQKIHKYGKFPMMIAAISPLPYIPLIFGAIGLKRRDFLLFGFTIRIIGIILFALLFI